MGDSVSPSAAAESPSGPLEDTSSIALLDVRIEPRGPMAERGIAKLCASGLATRDPEAELGAPAATASGFTDGERVVSLLVEAAALALDDTDLHLTIHRR
jgi:hypothetical protein